MRTFDLFKQQLQKELFKRGRKYITIFMDNHDGYRTVSWEPEYRQFDLILRSKLNPRAWHPENIRPWAYGLTNRVTEATAGAKADSKRPYFDWAELSEWSERYRNGAAVTLKMRRIHFDEC